MNTTFLVIAGAVALGSVVLSALLLWFSCKIVSVPGARLHQAIIVVLISTILSVAVGVLFVLALPTHELRPLEVLLAYLFLLLISVFIPLVCIRVQWKTSLLRALAVWLLWCTFSSVLGVVVGVPLGLVGRQFFEGFIVPTGAMAETIQGYHKDVTCPQCGLEFAINASQEVDPAGQRPVLIMGCTCPNCRLPIEFGKEGAATPTLSTGDRVLVNKKLDGAPECFDVIVFRYPGPPFGGAPQGSINYIKRLVGLPGETIGIRQGDLYVLPGEQPSAEDLKTPEAERHDKPFMHEDEQLALLEDGDPRFGILRKPPDRVLALRRLVHDNDHPAGNEVASRWGPPVKAWGGSGGSNSYRHVPSRVPEWNWLRYQHVLREQGDRPQLITDFFGYNTFLPRMDGMGPLPESWVGDLILECEATVADPKGTFVLELSRGADRFRAHWDLETGECTLWRLKRPHVDSQTPDDFTLFEPFERHVGRAWTALKGVGTHRLRFANVDARLIVWVDDALVFGDVDYAPFKERGPYANDLRPASIGAKGCDVTVRHIKLYRDIYYTTEPGVADASPEDSDWGDPKKWEPLRQARGKTWYVQPGHYFTLGDNSLQSGDSRAWGLVPQRHLLGKAIFIYYPLAHSGPIR